jgi:pimeloyl-ACP methyl ester carboxylesterase
MVTFVLVPGAGGVSWYWHRVVPLLEEAQHEAIAVDLPGDDARAGLSVYADRVLEAIGRRELILVAQSLGGFTAPLEQGEAHERPEADVVFGEPCRFEAWPAVPIHVLAGRDDRFFPIAFQRRLAQERLQVTVDELPGGHLLALANPRGLADQLLGYLRAG